MSNDVSVKELETLFANKPKREANRILGVLNKTNSFFQAINTPIGKALLSDNVDRMEALLEKIIDEEATEKERAEFRALRDISLKWATKITKHCNAVKEVKNNIR